MPGLSLLVGAALALPVATLVAPTAFAGASACSGWTSTTRPPDYIRVYRNATGHVDRVPMRQYVLTVLGKEWPSYLPQQVIDAGAVAVKQYAWFHALGNGRVSRSGQCFDVTDGVGDQLYKPGRSRIRADHYTAVDATWGVYLVKGGQLFMTGYRTGTPRACGSDATGWKLFARSATRCADKGMGYLQILRTYYGPVSIVGSGANSTTGSTTPAVTSGTTTPAVTADNSVAPPAAFSVDNACAGVGAGIAQPPAAPPVATADPSSIGERAFSAA